MFIPVLLSWYIVGNKKFRVGIIIVEVEVNIFLISLMDATIQDGGSRERKDFVDDILIYSNNISAYY